MFLEKSSNFTSTFEFYVHRGKLWCYYNNTKYLFKDLVTKGTKRYPEVLPLLMKIYHHIIKHYSYLIPSAWRNKRWEEVLIHFILKYFPIYDETLDIFVRSNGDISFNFEIREKVSARMYKKIF